MQREEAKPAPQPHTHTYTHTQRFIVQLLLQDFPDNYCWWRSKRQCCQTQLMQVRRLIVIFPGNRIVQTDYSNNAEETLEVPALKKSRRFKKIKTKIQLLKCLNPQCCRYDPFVSDYFGWLMPLRETPMVCRLKTSITSWAYSAGHHCRLHRRRCFILAGSSPSASRLLRCITYPRARQKLQS